MRVEIVWWVSKSRRVKKNANSEQNVRSVLLIKLSTERLIISLLLHLLLYLLLFLRNTFNGVISVLNLYPRDPLSFHQCSFHLP